MSDKIYVIVWEYDDKSGFGILRAYEDKDKADYDLELIYETEQDKKFYVLTVRMVVQ